MTDVAETSVRKINLISGQCVMGLRQGRLSLSTDGAKCDADNLGEFY